MMSCRRRRAAGRKYDHRYDDHPGPIKCVIRGLAGFFGVPRGIVITGFVLGLIFVPLLTLLLFFAVLYWVHHPERVRDYADAVYGGAKRAMDRFWSSLSSAGIDPLRRGSGSKGRSGQPLPANMDPAALYLQFEAIDRRTRAIEAFVTSEEFRLNREFQGMERK